MKPVFGLIFLALALCFAAPAAAQSGPVEVTVVFVDDRDADEVLDICELQMGPLRCSVVNVATSVEELNANASLREAVEAAAAASNPDSPGADGTNAGGNDAPVTAATTIHGTPGNTPAFGGSSASPGGNGVGGGDGIHDIDGGSPGWDGEPAEAGGGGTAPACDMHGGLGDEYGNPDCD